MITFRHICCVAHILETLSEVPATFHDL